MLALTAFYFLFIPRALLLSTTARHVPVLVLTSLTRTVPYFRCSQFLLCFALLTPHVLSLRRQYVLRVIPIGGYVSFPNDYRVDKNGVVTELDDPDLLFNR